MPKTICPGCGRQTAVEQVVPDYKYRESGLPNIRLRGGVTRFACSECNGTFYKVEKEAQLLQVIAMILIMKPGPLTGPELRFIRGACDATQEQLAVALQLNRRETVAERESKDDPKLSAAEDSWFRITAMRLFSEVLLKPGRSHLEKSHRALFDKFVATYYLNVSKLEKAKAATRKPGIQVRLKRAKQGELWAVESPKVAA